MFCLSDLGPSRRVFTTVAHAVYPLLERRSGGQVLCPGNGAKVHHEYVLCISVRTDKLDACTSLVGKDRATVFRENRDRDLSKSLSAK